MQVLKTLECPTTWLCGLLPCGIIGHILLLPLVSYNLVGRSRDLLRPRVLLFCFVLCCSRSLIGDVVYNPIDEQNVWFSYFFKRCQQSLEITAQGLSRDCKMINIIMLLILNLLIAPFQLFGYPRVYLDKKNTINVLFYTCFQNNYLVSYYLPKAINEFFVTVLSNIQIFASLIEVRNGLPLYVSYNE